MKQALRLVALLGLLTSLFFQVEAQTPSHLVLPAKAVLTDCYRIISGDSVAMYYSYGYYLTPVACADVRRLTIIDSEGNFEGATQDYDLKDNHLMYRQHYLHGQRQGAFEAFYPNGQRSIAGSFNQGQPAGEWHFWRPDGRPQQQLAWENLPLPTMRLIACWDSTGQQIVHDGNGQWLQIQPQLRRLVTGPVVNALAQGTWECRELKTNKLLATEVFEKGKFKGGQSLTGRFAGRYKDHSTLEPVVDDPSGVAERYVLNNTCAELLAMRQQSDDIRTAQPKQPKPPGEASSYYSRCLAKLMARPELRQQLNNPYYTTTITATITEKGSPTDFSGGDELLRHAIADLLPQMGRWEPGTVRGQPAASRVVFFLKIVERQWQMGHQVLSVGNYSFISLH
ncbi:toxin-antitoxin system YwqK family antitoxin [Hymenobacter sp. BRD67]|uniref:toxin-antitoxin system YwqK family antitoxin n=1 Tax=Hymenobacter sp. BRD67 TaxID=2675877 RepID=UPI001566B83C|nr:hypothetical protein [Hymenobacter sp. BRD67]QKG54504.1 hypothetical protein GKZ67_20275 [Hymenobacter sp. BRD67]